MSQPNAEHAIRRGTRRQMAVMTVAGMIVASILTATPTIDAQVAADPFADLKDNALVSFLEGDRVGAEVARVHPARREAGRLVGRSEAPYLRGRAGRRGPAVAQGRVGRRRPEGLGGGRSGDRDQ